MPLYPYRCTQCGHRFEKIQSFNSEPETECPKCGGKLERMLTAPGLQFKGAGWYVNDYGAKGGSSSESSATESKAPADSSTASESKAPAAEKTSAPAAPAAAPAAKPSETKS